MIIQSENFIQNPLVSVVIVTYNQEQYIRQCIDSILTQDTDFPFEIIIGEDCGTDSTRDICIEYQQKYPERIKLLLPENNCGVLINWYNCIKESKGKYIAQCAGDDFWHNKNKIQIQTSFFEENPDYGIIHSDFDILHTKTGFVEKSVNLKSNRTIPVGHIMKELYNQYHIVAPTVSFVKQLFLNNVPYAEFIKRSFQMEDLPTFIIMSKYCKVGYINQSTATYRKGHFSISVQANIEKVEKFYNSLIEVMKYIFEIFPQEVEFNYTDLLIYKNKALFSNAFKFGNYKLAKQYGKILYEYGVRDKKILFCSNYFLFKIFSTLKNFRNDN